MKRVVVTGATGQIAYSLLFRIGSGEVFGDEKIALHLYDLPGMEKGLEGVVMELQDCAYPFLEEVRYGSDLKELFSEVDLALLVGAKPRGPGMERGDLLKDNGTIFVEQGRVLNQVASRDVKVVVVGNPCNTNALIAMESAPNLPRKNFHAMMRLDQNRAMALLARKAGRSIGEVSPLVVWGNHSATQVPDYPNASIGGHSATEIINDLTWLQGEFLTTVQKRGAAIIQARGKSSAASAANGVIDHVKSLYNPTPEGTWFSSAVCSDGNPYGIQEGIIFGFPCRSSGDGSYEIVPHLPWNSFIEERIRVTEKELLEEKECVEEMFV